MFNMERKDFNAIFSQNLRDMMLRRDIKQSELARLMNVSTATMSDWYNGKKTPRMDKIDAMCRFLNCARSDLMLEAGIERPIQVGGAGVPFSAADYELIIKIMQLDGDGRTLVDLVVDHELERVRAKK